ncbi:MAG: helix-turn-helix domain-containing protein [Pseudonocardiaceae bacterium]
MSDEHTDKISGQAGDTASIDPALFERDDVRRVLAAMDIGTLYRVLGDDAGISQRQIAARTGQAQSEVSDIIARRRRVESHQVLVRIADGFDIPRELMGLSWWGPDGTYCGEVTVAEPSRGVSEAIRRRALIAATSMATLGQVLQGLGELTELALPTSAPLPSRLGMSHVHAVEAVTEQLRGVARQFGGQADLFGAAARYYTRWLSVPASDVVNARLRAALAELHTEAGWCCYDSGIDGMGYFTRALGLADQAGDGFGIANAAWHAGATLVRSGHPDDALKEFQLGQFVLAGLQPGKAKPATLRADDARVPSITARLGVSSAAAYALLDRPGQAGRALAVVREDWQPRDVYERADKDLNAARIQADLGQIDSAEQLAATAVHTFDGAAHRRDGAMARLVLAELHVRAGEPRGIALARHAIDEVSQLHSIPTRQELEPLATALETRPGSDAKELARTARQVAATRV